MLSDTVTVSETILKALQPMAFARGLEARHLVKLASIATLVPFEEGETIFQEGDSGNTLYLVERGRVALYIQVPGRGRVTILTVEAGRLLGWSAMFPPHHRTAGARALCAVRLIALDAARLRAMCRADPELGYAVMLRLAEAVTSRLVATRLQLLDLCAPPDR
ncbi:MAG: cyclic nucleotide-binding domain-containing protein [Caldilineae bacterium]|nr:MAG: cyclic nucleotide-binding domain-containing protein [Caldilineae bacterium]